MAAKFKIDTVWIGELNRYDRLSTTTTEFLKTLPEIDIQNESLVEFNFIAGKELDTELTILFTYGYICDIRWHGKNITDDIVDLLVNKKILLKEKYGPISLIPNKERSLIRAIEKLDVNKVFNMG